MRVSSLRPGSVGGRHACLKWVNLASATTRLDVISQLRRHSGVVLYEICARYRDVGLTARQPWPWWRPVLTGSPDTEDSVKPEYRFEAKASFKQSWARGQRCIIPAATFDEPNWESGENVWWRFGRADRAPWGLAGLWNTWTDKATGELVESYTMLTLNADAHPLMQRMHKPDPKLGPTEQDKRSVVAIDVLDVDAWLHGTVAQAASLVRLTPPEDFDAGPMPR